MSTENSAARNTVANDRSIDAENSVATDEGTTENNRVALADGGQLVAEDLADRLERAAAKVADVAGYVEHADMARELTNQRREIEAVAEELEAGR